MLPPHRSICFLTCVTAALCAAGTSGCGTGNSGTAVPGRSAQRTDDVPPGPRADATQVATQTATIENPAVAAEAQPDDWFEDVTGRSGVNFTHRNGREAGRFYLIESHGGGAALVDFDLDGDVDLFVTGGGTISSESGPSKAGISETGPVGGLPSALFRNDRDWQFADVTGIAGFAEPPGYSQGCAITDFNTDGFSDLLVTCVGRSRLYANHGDGTFGSVADWAHPAREGYATAAAFGDIDRDGFPDLFLGFYTDWTAQTDVVCHSPKGQRDLCGPNQYAGTTCQFYHNAGDGSFDDWSAAAGMKGNVHCLGVAAADLNGDGWLDFFVAGDETPNQLYLGKPQLPLVESAQPAGVAVGESGTSVASMGIAIGDYNGDGRPDIFVTTFDYEDSSLYRNLGDGVFVYSTVAAKLAGISRMHVKFGTSLTDFDGDGWLDLFVLNGSPLYSTGVSPHKQLPELFRNVQGRQFEDVSRRGGAFFRQEHSGRGNSVGDLDDDGAPDLVTVQMNAPVRIQRNRMTPKNYVSVEVRARQGEPDATGAEVHVDYAGRRLVRFVTRGEGYLSQFDPRLILPVAADAAFADVVVAWPGRGREKFSRLAVRQAHLLIEGRGTAIDEGLAPP